MTNFTKFDQRKLTLADVIDIQNDDYAKRQNKIRKRKVRKQQGKGEKRHD